MISDTIYKNSLTFFTITGKSLFCLILIKLKAYRLHYSTISHELLASNTKASQWFTKCLTVGLLIMIQENQTAVCNSRPLSSSVKTQMWTVFRCFPKSCMNMLLPRRHKAKTCVSIGALVSRPLLRRSLSINLYHKNIGT